VFAACQRSLDKTSCRLDSHHQLYDQIAPVIQHFVRLRGQKRTIHSRTLFVEIANQNPRDAQLDARTLPDERVIPAHKLHQAAANRSATQQSDFQSANGHG
jgi:hypothetical protein